MYYNKTSDLLIHNFTFVRVLEQGNVFCNLKDPNVLKKVQSIIILHLCRLQLFILYEIS